VEQGAFSRGGLAAPPARLLICSKSRQAHGPRNRPKPAPSGHRAQDRRQRTGRRRRWRGSGGREQLKRHRRRLGPQGRERLGPQAEMLEDLLRHVGLLDTDRWNRAHFQGKASQHPGKNCSFVQLCGRLNRPKPPLPGHRAQDRRQRAGRQRRWCGSGGREQLKRHRRRLGPQGRERFGPQPEVLEDLPRRIGISNLEKRLLGEPSSA
jgi:hypothetical protein